jgi:TetR/AcrR family transcriptional regulator, transcriptional repressor of bet genes
MPRRVDHRVRREEIARAAAVAVAARGIEATTTADLAAAAGCTVGALPHYFRGKEAILLAALQYARRSVELRAARAFEASGGSLVDTLSAALPIDAGARRDCRVWLAFSGRAVRSKPIANEYRRRYRDLETRALVLFNGRRLPRGWDPPLVAENVFAFLDGLGIRALVEAGAWPAARLADALRRHLTLLGLE